MVNNGALRGSVARDAPSPVAAFQLDRLTKVYGGGDPAVDGIACSITPGSVTGLARRQRGLMPEARALKAALFTASAAAFMLLLQSARYRGSLLRMGE